MSPGTEQPRARGVEEDEEVVSLRRNQEMVEPPPDRGGLRCTEREARKEPDGLVEEPPAETGLDLDNALGVTRPSRIDVGDLCERTVCRSRVSGERNDCHVMSLPTADDTDAASGLQSRDDLSWSQA
jgi:hypothetical protein